jgi:hypothetical protein
VSRNTGQPHPAPPRNHHRHHRLYDYVRPRKRILIPQPGNYFARAMKLKIWHRQRKHDVAECPSVVSNAPAKHQTPKIHSSPGLFVSARQGKYEPRSSNCRWRRWNRNMRPLACLGERSRASKQTNQYWIVPTQNKTYRDTGTAKPLIHAAIWMSGTRCYPPAPTRLFQRNANTHRRLKTGAKPTIVDTIPPTRRRVNCTP